MSEHSDDGPHYLIMKRGLYERPDHQGYTGIRDQAGRYPLEEAKASFRHSGGECRWIHEEQAMEFLPAAWPDLVLKHVLDQRDVERRQVTELRQQLATVERERDHWKANHAEMVQRNAVLRERPDLPVDRLPAIARYEAQLATALGALARLSTFEAFTAEGWGFSHPEITARVDFARNALGGQP